MVFMPPGSAKSTYASVLFPPFILAQDPTLTVIAASHTVELAERFGRRVRNLIAEHGNVLGFGLAADSQAAGRWDTSSGGEYFAAGVRGPITGRRADLALIDDPVKSREEADSETIRERVKDWWRNDLYTRLKPGGRVVVLEFVPNPDRVSPPFPAMFSLTMLAETPGGDAYTLDELRRFLEEAGFTNVTAHPLPTPETVVIARR